MGFPCIEASVILRKSSHILLFFGSKTSNGFLFSWVNSGKALWWKYFLHVKGMILVELTIGVNNEDT